MVRAGIIDCTIWEGGTFPILVATVGLPAPYFGVLTTTDLASIDYRPLFLQYLMNRTSKKEPVK